jgi:hypothetical protein
MLDSKKIKQLFEELNEALKTQGEIGEIGLMGGAVMCLVYQSRKATRDVDAIFEPTQLIRKLAAKIGEHHNIGPHWMNDSAKAFLQPNFKREEVLSLSHLRLWAPEPEYMLAMKCISARWDTHDKDDVIFLIKLLKLKAPKQVFKIIQSYYAKNKIPPKTQFLIEELFSKKS